MLRHKKTLDTIAALMIMAALCCSPSQAEAQDGALRAQRQLRLSAPVAPHFVGLELGHSGSGGHIEATLGVGRLLRSGGLFPSVDCDAAFPCSGGKPLGVDVGARLHLFTTSFTPFIGAGVTIGLSTDTSPSIEGFMVRASAGLEWRHQSGFTIDIAVDAFLASIAIDDVEGGFEALPALHVGWAF